VDSDVELDDFDVVELLDEGEAVDEDDDPPWQW